MHLREEALRHTLLGEERLNQLVGHAFPFLDDWLDTKGLNVDLPRRYKRVSYVVSRLEAPIPRG